MSIDDRKTRDAGDETPRDEELRALYRQMPPDEPRVEVDDAILAAARRAVGASPKRATTHALPRALRWAVPVATAASLVLVVMLARDEHPERAAVPEALQEMTSVEQVRDAAPEPVIAPAEEKAVLAASKPVRLSAQQASPQPAGSGAGFASGMSGASADAVASAPAMPPAAPPAAAAVVAGESGIVMEGAVAEDDADLLADDARAQEAAIAPGMVRSKRLARESATFAAVAPRVVAPAAGMPSPPSAAIDWPWTTAPGERIADGWLAGYRLIRREGRPGDAAALFIVRSDGGGESGGDAGDGAGDGAAGWRDALAARLHHDHGWATATACANSEGIRLLREGAQVVLLADAGAVRIAWQSEAGCTP